MTEFSVVIPIFNEKQNLSELYRELKEVLSELGSHEILFVDDGSSDGSLGELLKLHRRDPSVVVIAHKRNYGQTAALQSGFREAKGKIIITMDGDLQNNPHDIPMLLEKLSQGYDVVAGWRHKRRDTLWIVIFSRVARLLRWILTKDSTHDPGCSLRVYKAEAVKGLFIYGEMHRFVTSLLKVRGYNVTEVKVDHRPRRRGSSKYTVSKIFRGFVDLLNYKFWLDYSKRPLHFFFKLGLPLILIGILLIFYNIFRYGSGLAVGPTLLLASILIISGVQFIGIGLIAELQVKTYFHSNPGELVQIDRIYRKNPRHN